MKALRIYHKIPGNKNERRAQYQAAKPKRHIGIPGNKAFQEGRHQKKWHQSYNDLKTISSPPKQRHRSGIGARKKDTGANNKSCCPRDHNGTDLQRAMYKDDGDCLKAKSLRNKQVLEGSEHDPVRQQEPQWPYREGNAQHIGKECHLDIVESDRHKHAHLRLLFVHTERVSFLDVVERGVYIPIPQYQPNNKLDYVWATSWGVSTRLIGALVMAHSDDDGLILPPRIAPLQAVIVPIYKNEEQKQLIDQHVQTIVKDLKALRISVKYDDSDNNRPGWKFAQYEMQGVPVRIAIGARDIENQVVEVARRDTREKLSIQIDGLAQRIHSLLEEIQLNIYNRAKAFRDSHITPADTWESFMSLLDVKGGFVLAHWDGTAETEEKIKEMSKATIRCIPFNNKKEAGRCILTGNPSEQRVLFARAY